MRSKTTALMAVWLTIESVFGLGLEAKEAPFNTAPADMTIVVLPAYWAEGSDPRSRRRTSSATDELTSALLREFGQLTRPDGTPAYNLRDPRVMRDVEAWKKAMTSREIDPETRVEGGREIGAIRILEPRVRSLNKWKVADGTIPLPLGQERNPSLNYEDWEALVVVDLQMVDLYHGISQGPTMIQVEGRGSGQVLSVVAPKNWALLSDVPQPLRKAINKAAEKAAKEMAERDPGRSRSRADVEMRVIPDGVDFPYVYLNAGASQGVQVGDQFVLVAGRKLKDRTGRILGYSAQVVAEVVFVDASACKAEVIDEDSEWPIEDTPVKEWIHSGQATESSNESLSPESVPAEDQPEEWPLLSATVLRQARPGDKVQLNPGWLELTADSKGFVANWPAGLEAITVKLSRFEGESEEWLESGLVLQAIGNGLVILLVFDRLTVTKDEESVAAVWVFEGADPKGLAIRRPQGAALAVKPPSSPDQAGQRVYADQKTRPDSRRSSGLQQTQGDLPNFSAIELEEAQPGEALDIGQTWPRLHRDMIRRTPLLERFGGSSAKAWLKPSLVVGCYLGNSRVANLVVLEIVTITTGEAVCCYISQTADERDANNDGRIDAQSWRYQKPPGR